MTLWSERIIVALPEDHPLAANEIIYWTDLKRERFLLSERDPGPEIQEILIAKLASPGDRPDVVRHDVSLENIKGLVGAGRGMTIRRSTTSCCRRRFSSAFRPQTCSAKAPSPEKGPSAGTSIPN